MNLKRLTDLKPHLPYLIMILILILVYFFRYLDPFTVPWSDVVGAYFTKAEILKLSWTNYKDIFPLWNPFWFSGTPFLAKAGVIAHGSIVGLLALLLPSMAAVKYSFLFNFLFAGIAMYALMIYLKQEPKFALISSTVYMFNGWILSRFINGHLTTLNGYPFLPLIILFAIKATKSREWLKYSIITGILFALQILGGPDMKVTLWTAFIFGIYLLFFCVGKNFVMRFKKAFMIGIIVSLILFGLTAVKVLPSLEHNKMSSRAHLSWEESTARKVSWGQLFPKLIEPTYEGMPKIHRLDGGIYNIGIFAFLLACFALFKAPKNKNTLYFWTIMILSFFLVTASFVFYILWRFIPPFDSFRYMPRTLVIFVFAGSALAGIGAQYFMRFLEEKYNLHKNKLKIVYLTIIALILLNLAVFGVTPYRQSNFENVYEIIDGNHILKDLSNKEGIFRIHTIETRGIDWGTEWNNVPLDLKNIFGGETEWYIPYFNIYLGNSFKDPAKFWGMLNVKYITSTQEIDIPDLKFVKEYPKCDNCYSAIDTLQKVGGPYLYENEKFIPKAQIVNNAVLVIGKDDNVVNTIYSLMLNPRFNPKNTVIIKGKQNINDYSLEDLSKFSSILLLGGEIHQSSINTLKSYIEKGGVLIPNVVEGKSTISEEDINEILTLDDSDNFQIPDKDIITKDFDNYIINLNNVPFDGFLVYSETFSLYPGWKSSVDEKERKIYNANAVVSTVYITKDENIIHFNYKPNSFIIGSWITLMTILIVLGYFIYRRFNKHRISY